MEHAGKEDDGAIPHNGFPVVHLLVYKVRAERALKGEKGTQAA